MEFLRYDRSQPMKLQRSSIGFIILFFWGIDSARVSHDILSRDNLVLKRQGPDNSTDTNPHPQLQPPSPNRSGFKAQPGQHPLRHGHTLKAIAAHSWEQAQTSGDSHEASVAATGPVNKDAKKKLRSQASTLFQSGSAPIKEDTIKLSFYASTFTIFVLASMVIVGVVGICFESRQPPRARRNQSPAQKKRRLKVDFLKQVELFKRLPVESLADLAKAATVKEFAAGEPIIKQGDEGSEFFLIRCGLASTEIDGQAVSILNPGDYFGEHSLVCSEPRIVTIRCQTAVTAFSITKEQFIDLGLLEKLCLPKRVAVTQVRDHDVIILQPTPKTPEEEQLIIDAVKMNRSLEFMRLTETSIKEMAAFAWKMEVASGTQIISQSDLTADYFYIVQEGAFLVTIVDAPQASVASSRGSHERLSRLTRHSKRTMSPVDSQGHIIKKGGSFGALALLYNAPRAATVTAKKPSAVWVIARPHFKEVLLKAARQQSAEHVHYLNNVEMTKDLPEQLKVKVAEALCEITFNKGDVPFRQGDERNLFYILTDGTVNMMKDGVSLCLNGDYFTASAGKGVALDEWSLESEGDRHRFTVEVLTGKARCLVLDWISYQILLGKHSPHSLPRLPCSQRKFGEIQFRDVKRLGMLGSGAFGAVELSEHTPTGETYALKIQRKAFIVEKHFEHLILNEKNLHLMCDSPFITRLVETFNGEESLFMLLELCLGGDVLDLYNKKGLWGWASLAKYYSAGMVFAFEHLHSKKIIHRDLKPENMLLSITGHVKLTDMGLAKFVVGKTFTICGTEEYFAPEVIASKGTNRAVDWWTLGIVIFELLGGYSPFNSPSPMGIFKNIGDGIENVNFPQECEGDARELIHGLCQKEPHERLPMKQGATDNIKDHAWYKDFDWNAMANLSMDPPYVPPQTVPIRWDSTPEDVPYRDPGTGWDKDYATSA